MRIFLFIPLILLSCNDSANSTEKQSSRQDSDGIIHAEKEVGNSPGHSLGGKATCYWQIMQRDTFVAAFSQTGPRVSGKLTFDNYQKDGSSGTVEGKTENDIMKLWYSFESEGMHSVMEVWFKEEGDLLLRGTGEMHVRSDSSYFSDPGAVSFKNGQELKKVDCDEIPLKYK